MEDYTKDIENIENAILDQYVNDDNPRPWIIAFSGGKDSTTVLQLVWNSVSRLVPSQRRRDIHIVCNNTLIENPTILEYVKKQLESISSRYCRVIRFVRFIVHFGFGRLFG